MYEKNFFSPMLLLSTFMGTSIVSMSFVNSAIAMEEQELNARATTLETFIKGIPILSDFQALPEGQQRNFIWELRHGPLYQELVQKVGDMTTGRSKTDEEKIEIIKNWLRVEKRLADYIENIKHSLDFQTFDEKFKKDFENSLKEAGTGSVAQYSPIQSYYKTPEEKIEGIKKWYENCLKENSSIIKARHQFHQDTKELQQMLKSINTRSIAGEYGWMTEKDHQDFEEVLKPGSGLIGMRGSSFWQESSETMKLIKNWLAERYQFHQDTEELQQMLKSINTRSIAGEYGWMTEKDHQDFEEGLKSPTGFLGRSGDQILEEPARSIQIVKEWLAERKGK